MENLKVLIADDSKINNDMMKLHIEKCDGIEIVGIVEDGMQEYDLIKELQPDLVITDNQMPKMTGVDVIKKIAEETIEQKPAFLLVTGDMIKDLDFAKMNLIGFINKPVDYDRVLDIINDFKDERNNPKVQRFEEQTVIKNDNWFSRTLKKVLGK